MTKREAEAANVVIRWAFSKSARNARSMLDGVDELQHALELLADGAHRSLGNGVTRDDVRAWAAPTWTAKR